MAAINDTYGTDYYYTNLTDYTQLDTALPNPDILLIPEQELLPDAAAGKTIGQAQSTTLTPWVNNGGIVIFMEGGGVADTIHFW